MAGKKGLSCKDIFGSNYTNQGFYISDCGEFEDPIFYLYDEILQVKKKLFGNNKRINIYNILWCERKSRYI